MKQQGLHHKLVEFWFYIIIWFYVATNLILRSQGGRGARTPHWPEKYAKYHVFRAFEANFCSKNENSPPNGIGNQKL